LGTPVVAVAGVAFLLLITPDHIALRQPLAHERFNYPLPLPAWAPPPPDYDAAANLVLMRQRTGDAIIYADTRQYWQGLSMDYRMRGGARPDDVWLKSTPAASGTFFGTDCSDLTACFGAPPRVWVVAIRFPEDPIAPMGSERAAIIRNGYILERKWPLPGLTLAIYSRR
jgi:mannosyltransferase